MDILTATETYQTLRVRFDDDICFVQIHRPQANNTINDRLIAELGLVLSECEAAIKILVLEGLPEVFCFGADFNALATQTAEQQNPEPLYNLWLQLSSGPYLTIAHVRGKANAGGIGFVAACDLVLCEDKAVFSLSELLFGLMPACVLPFLIRRIGFARANAMTLMTQPVAASQALDWGLADVCEANSEQLLRKQLLRLRRMSKSAICRYKTYVNALDNTLALAKPRALAANREVFSDADNLAKIKRYITSGKFPWEE